MALPAMHQAASGSGRRATLRERLEPFIGTSRLGLAVLGIASIVSGFAEAAILVLLVQVAIAISSADSTTGNLIPALKSIDVGVLIAAAGALTVARLGLQWAGGRAAARMSADFMAKLRKDTLASYVNASWDLQSRERFGHLQEVMTTHITRAAQAILVTATGIVAGFQFASLLISALVVNALAAFGIVVAATSLFFLLRPISSLGRKYSREQADANVAYATAINETVTLAQEIRVFDVGKAIRQRVDRQVDDVAEPYFKSQFLTRMVPSLYQGAALSLVVAGLGVLHFLDVGNVGSLGAVVLLLVRALTYSQQLQFAYHQGNDLIPYVLLVKTTKDQYGQAAIRRGNAPLARIESLEFDDVSFSYVRDVKALDAVSFRVESGEFVGIAGPSGAGKSTFVQLLLRLREPSEGRYLLNGSDATQVLQSDWFRRIAFVPQEPRLLTGTVRDNIRFFREDIDDEAVERAVRMAHVEEDILEMPDGFDTLIGERGAGVSGGQRQRIAIARALAGSPDLLVLDEPTSALDMRSESLVQETLASIRGSITLFVIAHRLSTLRICDRVMVFGRGRLQGFGTAAVLAETNAFYREAIELSGLN